MVKEVNKPFDQKAAGEKLRELRQKNGLTAKEVANKIQCTESTICSYEIGRRSVSDANKVKLANVYEVRVEDIFFKQ